jgi:hypothetical protein
VSNRGSPPGDPGEFVGGGGGRRRGERRGAGPCLEVESPAPVTKGHRGGRGAGAHGERGGACRREVSGGRRAHHRGANERSGSDDRRRGGAS